MTSHEIFERMPSATAGMLFTSLRERQQAVYRNLIETLAGQRKVRAVFIERKPREERHAWLKGELGKARNGDLAAHLLQLWLVGTQSQLLCDFLDALGIAHEDDGTVEQLPPAPPIEKLREAVEAVLQRHDATVVALYLHAFQALNDASWSALEEILTGDERLRF